jgi:hypothetical protein
LTPPDFLPTLQQHDIENTQPAHRAFHTGVSIHGFVRLYIFASDRACSAKITVLESE